MYPERLPQRLWLPHIARVVDTVEANGTFYKLPRAPYVKAWAEKTPRRFRFALKMWRGVTHLRRLKEPQQGLAWFFEAARELPVPQRGPILVQLHPAQRADPARLDAFLDAFRDGARAARAGRWKVAVEFRHPSWNDAAVRRVLDRQRAALVVHDMVGGQDEANGASWVYYRRHGPRGDHWRGYSEAQMREQARVVRAWCDEGRTVYAYYNNDGHGYAVRDALRLRSLVEGDGALAGASLERTLADVGAPVADASAEAAA